MQANHAEPERRRGAPCSHPAFHREYLLGYGTGDYVCEACKGVFTPQEVEEIEGKRRESSEQ